jgi:chromosome segregation ATPase
MNNASLGSLTGFLDKLEAQADSALGISGNEPSEESRENGAVSATIPDEIAPSRNPHEAHTDKSSLIHATENETDDVAQLQKEKADPKKGSDGLLSDLHESIMPNQQLRVQRKHVQSEPEGYNGHEKDACLDSDKESLHTQLEHAREREGALAEEKAQLAVSLQSLQDESSRREHQLHQDKLSLEQRCQRAEARAEELAAGVPRATEPLMRQIEELQTERTEQAQLWSESEKKLREQLHAAEQRARAAEENAEQERQRAQSESSRADELAKRLEYERQRATQSENSLEQSLSEAQSKAEHVEKEFERVQASVSERERELSSSQKEVSYWRQELLEEQSKTSELREEVNRLSQSLEEMKEKESSQSSSQQRSKWSDDAVGNESEESLLRKKNRKLQAAEERVRELEKVRSELEQQLVEYQRERSNSNTNTADANRLPKSSSLGDEEAGASLQKRYGTALELLGERDEEVEQLQFDVHELKSVVQSQADTIAQLSMSDNTQR